jgi:hypothetical protein
LGLFASALALGGLLANGMIPDVVHGSGRALTERRAIDEVKEVVVSGSENVRFTRSDVPTVSVTADDNLLPYLQTSVSNGKLTFRTRTGYSVRSVTPITYTVALPRLERLSVSGAAKVQAAGVSGDALTIKLSGAGNITLADLDCKNLSLTLSGAGNATLSGKADTIALRLSGAGDLDAGRLKAEHGEVQISGAGTTTVWATEDLKARISGAGTVYYKGQPRIEQKISGAGSLKSVN